MTHPPLAPSSPAGVNIPGSWLLSLFIVSLLAGLNMASAKPLQASRLLQPGTSTGTPTASVTPPPARCTFMPTGSSSAFHGTLRTVSTSSSECPYYLLYQCEPPISGDPIRIAATDVDLTALVDKDVKLNLKLVEACACGAMTPPPSPYYVVDDTVTPISEDCPTILEPVLCPSLARRVPAAKINAALAEPYRVYGWKLRCNPAVPWYPFNPRRRYLTLRVPGLPYNPIFNSLVYACGCQ